MEVSIKLRHPETGQICSRDRILCRAPEGAILCIRSLPADPLKRVHAIQKFAAFWATQTYRPKEEQAPGCSDPLCPGCDRCELHAAGGTGSEDDERKLPP